MSLQMVADLRQLLHAAEATVGQLDAVRVVVLRVQVATSARAPT